MNIFEYCSELHTLISVSEDAKPWELVNNIKDLINAQLDELNDEYVIKDAIAIHKTARIDETAIVIAPAIVGPDCFIGPHALLRNGVILLEGVHIGPGCEVKSSIIGNNTAIAHFNFVGDSLIGSEVNLEGGAVIANYFNEREDKTIYAIIDGVKVNTGSEKFGAIIGDSSKIGANAVISPGTILKPRSVVKRLELVEQS